MTELERREQIALTAIKRALETEGDGNEVVLFIEHHLEELDEGYWQGHLEEKSPSPESVLELLVLQSHWSDDEEHGLDVLDFTLPEDATNYVISVRFDESGNVEGIAMES